jgi:hypothetical protein
VQLHDTITRVRAPLVAASYGNRKRDWAAATEQDFLVHWSTKTVDEVVGDEARTVVRGKVFGGPDLDLEATDRVVFQGETFEVDGDVMRSYRQGVLHHVRAMLKKISTGS